MDEFFTGDLSDIHNFSVNVPKWAEKQNWHQIHRNLQNSLRVYNDNGNLIPIPDGFQLEKFQCKICGKQTFTESGLEAHLIRCHTAKRGLLCPYCKNTNTSRHGLEGHMKTHRHKYCDADYQRVIAELHAKNVPPLPKRATAPMTTNALRRNRLETVVLEMNEAVKLAKIQRCPTKSIQNYSTADAPQQKEIETGKVNTVNTLKKVSSEKIVYEKLIWENIEACSKEEKVENINHATTFCTRQNLEIHLEKNISGIKARELNQVKNYDIEEANNEKIELNEIARKNPASESRNTQSLVAARKNKFRLKANGESIKNKNVLQSRRLLMVRREANRKRKQMNQLIFTIKQRSIRRLKNSNRISTLLQNVNYEKNDKKINVDKTWSKTKITNVLGETPEEVYADLVETREEVSTASIDTSQATRPVPDELMKENAVVLDETHHKLNEAAFNSTCATYSNVANPTELTLDETRDKYLNEANQTGTLPCENTVIGSHVPPQINDDVLNESMPANEKLATVFDNNKMPTPISKEDLFGLNVVEMDTTPNEFVEVEPRLPAPVKLKRAFPNEDSAGPEQRVHWKKFCAPHVTPETAHILPQSTTKTMQNAVSFDVNVCLPQEVNCLQKTSCHGVKIAEKCDQREIFLTPKPMRQEVGQMEFLKPKKLTGESNRLDGESMRNDKNKNAMAASSKSEMDNNFNNEPIVVSVQNAQFYIPICSQVTKIAGSATFDTIFTKIQHVTTLNVTGIREHRADGSIRHKFNIPQDAKHLVPACKNGKNWLEYGFYSTRTEDDQHGQMKLDTTVLEYLMSERGRESNTDTHCQGVLHATFDLLSGQFTPFNCTNSLGGMKFPIPEHVQELAECVAKSVNHELVIMSSDLRDWVLSRLFAQSFCKSERKKFSAFNKLTGETILFLLNDGDRQMGVTQTVCVKPTQTCAKMSKYTLWYGSEDSGLMQRLDKHDKNYWYQLKKTI